MKLSQTKKLRTATVDLGDGLSFDLKYRTFSPNDWDAVKSTEKEDWGIVKQLTMFVAETGLEDDDGNPLPPTEDTFRKIEMPVLHAMIDAILNTTLPKKQNSETSADGTQPEASSESQSLT